MRTFFIEKGQVLDTHTHSIYPGKCQLCVGIFFALLEVDTETVSVADSAFLASKCQGGFHLPYPILFLNALWKDTLLGLLGAGPGSQGVFFLLPWGTVRITTSHVHVNILW